MGRSLGVLCLLLLACDRGEQPQPAPAASSAGVVRSAAAALPAASATAPTVNPPAPSATAAVAPTLGTLRLSIVSDAELLKSEQNQATILQKFLEKAAKHVDVGPTTDDERSYVKALAAGSEPPPLPASLSTFETVVLLRVEPARSLGGAKTSGGRTHVAIVHPPAREPAFSMLYTDRVKDIGSATFDGTTLGNWLQAHLKLREKGKTP